MYLFSAINREDEEKYLDYIKMYCVAALTARQTNPDIKINLLFSGEEDDYIRKLRNFGVNVINCYLSFTKDVRLAYDGIRRSVALGAFLRVDLPKICNDMGIEDEHILYTDCDVMFLKEISDIKKNTPKYFSVAGEFSKEIVGNMFNSGVMWINWKNMYSDYESFVKYITGKIPNISAYDQGALREFYSDKFEHLDYRFNFKSYWNEEKENDIYIFHFHGPKPTHIKDIKTHKHKNLAGPVYFKMTKLFENKLSEFENIC